MTRRAGATARVVAGGWAVLLGAVSACGRGAGTELALVVDTDLAPNQFNELTLTGWGTVSADGAAIGEAGEVRAFARAVRGGADPLPGSLRVAATADRPALVVLEDALGGTVRRTLLVRHLGARAGVLCVTLSARCAAVRAAASDHPCPGAAARCTQSQSCEARGQTCGNDGECRGVEVLEGDIAPLPDGVSLQNALRADAGTSTLCRPIAHDAAVPATPTDGAGALDAADAADASTAADAADATDRLQRDAAPGDG